MYYPGCSPSHFRLALQPTGRVTVRSLVFDGACVVGAWVVEFRHDEDGESQWRGRWRDTGEETTFAGAAGDGRVAEERDRSRGIRGSGDGSGPAPAEDRPDATRGRGP